MKNLYYTILGIPLVTNNGIVENAVLNNADNINALSDILRIYANNVNFDTMRKIIDDAEKIINARIPQQEQL